MCASATTMNKRKQDDHDDDCDVNDEDCDVNDNYHDDDDCGHSKLFMVD